MAGRMITPVSTVKNMILTDAERKIRASAYDIFFYGGEYAVSMARTLRTYGDVSGNLNSSVGYVVLDNGRVIMNGGFEKVKNGDNGIAESKKFMNELIKKNRKGIRLIVVAGMNYAAIVEDKYKKKVLKFTKKATKEIIDNLLVKSGFKL